MNRWDLATAREMGFEIPNGSVGQSIRVMRNGRYVGNFTVKPGNVIKDVPVGGKPIEKRVTIALS